MAFGGQSHFKKWYESDPNNCQVGFSYYSHQSKNRNFPKGQLGYAA